jgi:hypothetical protein
MAESLAFNQTIGYSGNDPLSDGMRHYIDFYRRHRDLFTATQGASTVAVLRSYPSITYNHAQLQRQKRPLHPIPPGDRPPACQRSNNLLARLRRTHHAQANRRHLHHPGSQNLFHRRPAPVIVGHASGCPRSLHFAF